MVLELYMVLSLAMAETQLTSVERGPRSVWIVDDEDALSAAGRRTMQAEVDRIWSPYGVDP